MKPSVEAIIKRFDMQPHPEGGYFKETYRSDELIEKGALSSEYSGSRNHSTCIYFLLVSGNFSAFHKIPQDEIWHFYDGSPVELHTISKSGEHNEHQIGRDLESGQVPQLVVRGGHWFASKVATDNSYSLVGCTVTPGFDFEDFELADRAKLISEFPTHQHIIEQFTH